MFTVYVLHSLSHDKIYIGVTSNMEERFKSHNELGKKGWTKNYRPWNIIYKEEYLQKSNALKREKQLKSSRGRGFIWSLIEKNK